MAENLSTWPSKRGPISKIRPSDGKPSYFAISSGVKHLYVISKNQCGGDKLVYGSGGIEAIANKLSSGNRTWPRRLLAVASASLGRVPEIALTNGDSRNAPPAVPHSMALPAFAWRIHFGKYGIGLPGVEGPKGKSKKMYYVKRLLIDR